MVKIEAKLTKKEMFNFMLRHNYYSLGGVCGVIISIGALVLFFANINNDKINNAYKIALLFVGVLFIVVQPIMLYIKSCKQVKNSGSINKPLVYEFNDREFTISMDEESVSQSYADILKVISTRLSVIIYINRYRAFILPKSCIGENLENLKKLISDNAKNAREITVK